MKICHVTNYLPGYHSHAGGAEQACVRTAKASEKAGAAQSFLTLSFDKKLESPLTPLFQRGEDDVNSPDVTPLRTLDDFSGPLKKYLEIFKWYIFQFDPPAYFSALWYFRKYMPDVVHFHNFQFLTFAVLSAAKKSGLRVCLSVYDYWYFCPVTTLLDENGKICRDYHGIRCLDCLPGKMRPVQGIFLFFRKKLIDYFLNKIDVFIVLSQSSKNILTAYGIAESRISVIPLPPAEDFGKMSGVPPGALIGAFSGTDSKTVLFIGWLQKRKGLHVLLEAMKDVWKSVPGTKLKMIVQKVKWEAEYDKIIQGKLNKMDSARYEYVSGQMKSGEIKSAIAGASVVVIPEQWENMSPLLVIEAMELRKAVVASNLGGIPEFIKDGETGFLAEYSNPGEFALKIIALLKDKQLADTIGERAHTSILSFYDNAKITEKLMAVYERMSR